MEIVDPDWGETFVVRAERNQKTAAYYGDMWRSYVVSLKVSEAEKVRVAVSGSTFVWSEIFNERCPRFDQKATSDWRSQEWLDDREIGGFATIGVGKEPHPARE